MLYAIYLCLLLIHKTKFIPVIIRSAQESSFKAYEICSFKHRFWRYTIICINNISFNLSDW